MDPIYPDVWKARSPRKIFLQAFFGLIAGGMLFCTVTNSDYWPITNYPMFSWAGDGGIKKPLELCYVENGVEKAFMREETLLDREFDMVSVGVVAGRISRKYGMQSDEMKAFMRLLLRDLEKDSPRISSLKLYKAYYEQPTTGVPAPRLLEKKLILEVGHED